MRTFRFASAFALIGFAICVCIVQLNFVCGFYTCYACYVNEDVFTKHTPKHICNECTKYIYTITNVYMGYIVPCNSY